MKVRNPLNPLVETTYSMVVVVTMKYVTCWHLSPSMTVACGGNNGDL